MISDILSDAIYNIREYQREMPDVYDDSRPIIEKTLLVMDALRSCPGFDCPPGNKYADKIVDALLALDTVAVSDAVSALCCVAGVVSVPH